jgi:hypothetical protein
MRKEAIGGFNSFLESHQKASGQAKLTLVLFDHEYIVAQDDCPVQQVQKLDTRSYQPRGNTALLDAIGRTIKTVGERLDHTSEQERPGRVLIVILTDGLENASQEFSLEQINQMIQHQREGGLQLGVYLPGRRSGRHSSGHYSRYFGGQRGPILRNTGRNSHRLQGYRSDLSCLPHR